jgi:DNA-binding CsgD family transcriptional regulator
VSHQFELEAELAVWSGQPDACARVADEGLRRVGGEGFPGLTLIALVGIHAQADRAELARARRDDEAAGAAHARARELRDAAREPADAWGHAALTATLEAELARAAGNAEPGLWDTAAASWEARPNPYRAAYARWRQAEAALASGRDRPQATAALAAAHATATSLGALPLLDEIVRLARRARIELPAHEPEPADAAAPNGLRAGEDVGLTPREREVLEHLAQGETNRQIADALFISARTAGVHVSHILGKLDASNRGEAAAIAHRLGLVR